VTDEATQTQFYTGHTGNTIVIAFRGSKSQENWDANFQYSKVAYPPVSGMSVCLCMSVYIDLSISLCVP
jgi:hypothetical protein